MRRRTFLTASLGTAGVIVLGGCSDEDDAASPRTTAATGDDPAGLVPAPRPTIRLPGEDVGFPSPFAYMRGPGYVQMSYLYDSLLWNDADGEVMPWLASEFDQSDDGLTYSFVLRDGVTWHDGQPLTPDDVVFTFDYFTSQTLSPQVIVQPSQQGGVAEVVATGGQAVEFRLDAPDATFLEFVAAAVPIVPRHIWEPVPEAARATDPALLVGSGPYRLESYTSGEGAYLYTANDDYFLGTPFVERIENIPVGDELNALLTGDIDAAGGSGLRPEILAPFEADDAFDVLEGDPGAFQIGLYWNLARGGALADVVFRRACARAIDREELVERLFGGNGTPGNPGWIPPGDPAHVEVEQYPFDRDAANQMLDDAGYTRDGDVTRVHPDGRPLQFVLLTTSPPSPVTELIVSSLAEIGVELTAEALDTPTFNQRVLGGDVEMSLIASGGMNGYPDYLRRVYASYTRLTQHAQGYMNPEVDRLCREQLTTLDDEERQEILAEIQELVAADLPLLPLFYPTPYHIYRPETFDAWYYTPGGLGGNIPTATNKHVFVTGVPTGTDIRPIAE
ncbi:MAG TPA: ABC transporter substrate-binding protein [Acidimicrobiales bacterium]|nr:ABC transporter substrate-binding protein [Acidimicrobiales bacterium]